MKNGSSVAKRFSIALLGLLFAVCLSLGLYYTVPKTVRAEENKVTPAAVFVLGVSEYELPFTPQGTTYVENQAQGWSAAVERARQLKQENAENTLVKVVLASDWTASPNALEVTTFGAGEGFELGALVVSGIEIEFDLNGNVLNRGLTNTINQNGHIFVVKNGGSLSIIDSNPEQAHLNNTTPLYTYQDGEDTVAVTGGILTGAYGTDGGAISVEDGELFVKGVTFLKNRAQNGGAIYALGEVTFDRIPYETSDEELPFSGTSKRTVFAENSASENGGAVYATSLSDFTETKFVKNTAGENGGALYLPGNSSKLFVKTAFTQNRANGAGGAIFARSDVMLYQSSVLKNTAGTYGGGIYFDSASVLNVYDTTISENEAGTSGGGIALNALVNDTFAQVGLVTSTLANNEAAVSGGGIFVNGNVQLVLLDSTVQENETTGQGGGIYAYSASAQKAIKIYTQDNTEVKANKALSGGGAYLHSNTEFYCFETKVTGNQATQDGGGVFLTGGGNHCAQATVWGEVVVNNNVKGTNTASNLCFGNAACVLYVTQLKVSGSAPQIGLSPADGQKSLIRKYTANNSPEGFAENPAKYFFADDGAKILLGADGEVTTGTTEAVWKVNGNAVEDYGVAIPYGETVTSVTLNDGANLITSPISQVVYADGKVSSHEVSAKLGDLDVKFHVRVNPKQITADDVSFTQNITTLPYNGSAQEPEVTVTVGSKLVNGTDYTVSYSNNRNAGNATVLVQGTGNYAGEVELDFEITPLSANYASAVWEYYYEGEWSSAIIPPFTYNGENLSAAVRVKLEVSGIAGAVDYVYAQGVVPEDKTNWNDNMWISFAGSNDKTITEFVNAAEYTATIGYSGETNAKFAAGFVFTKTLTIQPQRLSIAADTFTAEGAYRDEAGNKLWLVNFNGTKQGLLDGNGLQYVENGTVKYGAIGEVDTYARFRNAEIALELNGDYLIGGVKLQEYLQSAKEVIYEHNHVTGREGAVIATTTTVRITLSDNYSTLTSSNILTITKSWKLVTINNMFTTMGDTEVPTPKNWTFGSQIGLEPLKPQQGNTVIYSFQQNVSGTQASAGEFAALFNEQGELAYYGVSEDAADLAKPMVDENGNAISDYFTYFVERLGAGSYTMVARVPRGAGGADVVPITREFTFTVAAFDMLTEQGALRDEFSYYIRNTAMPYNGESNNVPELTLTFNGRLLVRGVDYELTSPNVNVGAADLTVTGMGGLVGSFVLEGAYDIVPTVNDWTHIPSIMYWSYHNYDKEINRLSAQPRFLEKAEDMWFKVTLDSAGQNPVEGLEEFRLENGLVNDEVAEKLTALKVGSYYLFARVESSANYSALEPEGIEFRVFQAENFWEESPTVATWIVGSYNEDENTVTAKSRFGKVTVVVTDEAGNEIYNSQTGVNLFADAEVGTYLITATVAETDDYSALSYTATFRVFEKAGLPWWVTLVVVLAVLLVVGIVLFVLSKKGVLQVLSGKMVVAIRAKASADATIAAVKANKVAEEAKAALALAEARERIEALRLANEEAKNRPVEEQAAVLEERAMDAARKAERMQKKAARMQKQAAYMKGQAAIGAESDIGDPALKDEAAASDDVDDE